MRPAIHAEGGRQEVKPAHCKRLCARGKLVGRVQCAGRKFKTAIILIAIGEGNTEAAGLFILKLGVFDITG